MAALSIIVPMLDEAATIVATLERLQDARGRGVEVIAVDGGSTDATRKLAAPLADHVMEAPKGRATQMNAGARASSGTALLFLHADTILPDESDLVVLSALQKGRAWGRFDVAIAGSDPMLAVVALMMNARSRWSGIATGDQGIFMTRAAFDSVGGFPDIPLMEDVAISKRLREVSAPLCLRERVVTSARRWERHGTLRTIVLMWRLRFAYAMGVDPRRLARRYDAERIS